jgi:hypothetical protein
MAGWTALYSGSNTISTTEFSLTLNSTSGVPAAKTDKGTMSLTLDVSAVVAGDKFEVKLYDKCRSADTQRQSSKWIIQDAQSEPVWMTPPLMIGEGWDFTIKRLAGTDRVITSSVRAYT